MLTDEKIENIKDEYCCEAHEAACNDFVIVDDGTIEDFARAIEKQVQKDVAEKIAVSIDDDCDKCLCLAECSKLSNADGKACNRRIVEHVIALMLRGEK